MITFGMITTKASESYTKLALDSFFKNTKLSNGDNLIVIDNNNSGFTYGNLNVIKNNQPKSFAQNVNFIINNSNNNDVVILNNDVVFTPRWLDSLRGYSNCILIPSCNQTHQYDGIKNTMQLEEFDYDTLLNACDNHKKTAQGFFELIVMPFYVFYLPYKIYSKVGLFDESFGVGGGEDVDYRIRTIQSGFSVKYTNSSYLLHFHGKSTWDGGESEQDTYLRNSKYYEAFVSKYDKNFADVFLFSGQKYFEVITKFQLYGMSLPQIINELSYIKSLNGESPYRLLSAPGLNQYVKNLGENIVGCELGICLGYTLDNMLSTIPNIKKVYAVDAYMPYQDWWGFVDDKMVSVWKDSAFERLGKHMGRIEFLEMTTEQAASHIDDNSLDYIFIDGDHSYEAVKKDLRLYWDKVKRGGIFAGHDWNLPEVNKAVTEFRKEFGIYTNMIFCDKNVWFWYKD